MNPESGTVPAETSVWSGVESNSRPLPCEGIPTQLGGEVSQIQWVTSVHFYVQQRLTAVPVRQRIARSRPAFLCVTFQCVATNRATNARWQPTCRASNNGARSPAPTPPAPLNHPRGPRLTHNVPFLLPKTRPTRPRNASTQ